MPIRLNLLAEAQAIEEMRRKDPVKRAIWVAVLIVSAMLVWSSSVQVKAMMAKSDLGREEADMKACTNAFQVVLENQRKLAEFKHKMDALHQFSNCRFLQASVMNALQQASVDDVQLSKLRVEQAY